MIRVNSKNITILWLSLILFLQLFVYSFKLNIIIQILSLVIFYVLYKPNISISFLKHIRPLFVIFLLAFIGMLTIGNYNMFNIFKDILHLIKPLIGALLGYVFAKKIGGREQSFVKVIVWVGVLSALYHFYILIFKTNFDGGTISAIRFNAKDNFLEMLSLFLLLYYKKFYNRAFTNIGGLYIILLLTLILSIILYFSRTMIVIGGIFLLTFTGFTVFNKRNLSILLGIFLILILLYSYLFSIKLDPKAEGLEGFLYKIKMTPGEMFNPKLKGLEIYYLGENWRAYEVKCAYELMKSHPQSFIWGEGYGSLVNLKFWAPLGDYKKGMKYISELHNGYMYIFYKTGFIGLMLFLIYMFYLYNFINIDNTSLHIFISALGLALLFSTMVFSGIYNYRDIYAIILGGFLMYYFEKTV